MSAQPDLRVFSTSCARRLWCGETWVHAFMCPPGTTYLPCLRGAWQLFCWQDAKRRCSGGKLRRDGYQLTFKNVFLFLILFRCFVAAVFQIKYYMLLINMRISTGRRTKGEKNNTNFILVGNWVLVFVLHDQNFNYGCQTSSEVPFVTVINCVSISHFKNSDKICILLDKVGLNKRGCWELFFLNTKGGPDRLLRTTGVGGCLNHSLCD